MSLTVSPDLLAAAERGDVPDAEFVDCVRVSLPYAAFRPAAVGGAWYRRFVSPRGQLLNQTPELRDC